MPATILPFERPLPDAASPPPEPDVDPDTESPPPPSPVREFRPREAPTPRQIAHRWAMLSHLSRAFPRPPDTVR